LIDAVVARDAIRSCPTCPMRSTMFVRPPTAMSEAGRYACRTANLVSDDDVPLSEVTSGPFDISTDLNAAWRHHGLAPEVTFGAPDGCRLDPAQKPVFAPGSNRMSQQHRAC
jgi:uncharacterized protein (DUF779 family)